MVIQERLPIITIKTGVSPEQFLKRLHSLIPKQRDWRLSCFDNNYLGKGSVLLEIGYQGLDSNVPPNTLYLFHYDPTFDENRVQVQIITVISLTESIQITYDSYVYEACLIKPLLLSYNRSYKARVRLNIQPRNKTEPHLSPRLRESFDCFVDNANKSGLHTSDWGNFYRFIIRANQLNSRLVEQDIKYLLIKVGFYPEVARHMAEIYHHGRAILHGGHNQSTVEQWRRELRDIKKENEDRFGR